MQCFNRLAVLPSLLALGLSACSKEAAPLPNAANATNATAADADTAQLDEEPGVLGKEGDSADSVDVSASDGPARGGAGLLAEATRVFQTMTASSYSHKTQIEGTRYDVDCSGFVDYLLARVDQPALAELRAVTVRRPLAKHFVQLLSSGSELRSWQRIARIPDLTPGDIVAWLKPDDVRSSNTGHVMIVSAPPEPRKNNVWALAILDSSAAPHGSSDARSREHATGVGRGVVLIEGDSSGAPLAYHWSELRSSPRHATKIALGRVLP